MSRFTEMRASDLALNAREYHNVSHDTETVQNESNIGCTVVDWAFLYLVAPVPNLIVPL